MGGAALMGVGGGTWGVAESGASIAASGVVHPASEGFRYDEYGFSESYGEVNGGQPGYAPPPPPQRAPTAAKNDAKAKKASTTSRVQSGPNWGSTGGRLVPVQDRMFSDELCYREDGNCSTANFLLLPSFGDLARVAVAAWEAVFGGAAAPAAEGAFTSADVAFGLTRANGVAGSLVRFAGNATLGTRAPLSAATAALAPGAARNASIAKDTLAYATSILRQTGGKLRFNLEGFSISGATTPGSATFNSVTSAEYRGILADAFLKAQTVFYGTPLP
jgi:hypothetical protein